MEGEVKVKMVRSEGRILKWLKRTVGDLYPDLCEDGSIRG